MKNKKPAIKFDLEKGVLYEAEVKGVKGAKVPYIHDGKHTLIGQYAIRQAMDEPRKADNKFKHIGPYDNGVTINYGDAIMAKSNISLLFNGLPHLSFREPDNVIKVLTEINTPVAHKFIKTINDTKDHVTELKVVSGLPESDAKLHRIQTNRRTSGTLTSANQRIVQLEESERKYEIAQRESAAKISALEKHNIHLTNANERLENDLDVYKAHQSRMGQEIENWIEKCDQLQAKLAKKSLFSRLFNR